MNLNDGISTEEKDLARSQMTDYYAFVYPNFDMDAVFRNEPIKASDNHTVKIAVEVPDISLNGGSDNNSGSGNQIAPAKPVNEQQNNQPAAKPVMPQQPTQSAVPSQGQPQPPVKPQINNTVPNNGAPANSAPAQQQKPAQPIPSQSQPQKPAAPMIPTVPQVTKQDLDVINQKLSEIYKILDGYVSTGDLEEYENRISKIFNDSISSMDEKLESFKRTVIPPRKQYESDTLFKKNVLDNIYTILDNTLIPLFKVAPDYNLISFQSTQYYKDGSIKNALVCISIDAINNEYKYTFQVDVPVLNGIINEPTFLRKGNKVIPLIESAIQEELNSFSYQKAPVVDDEMTRSRETMYNTGEADLIHREDNQKQYPSGSSELRSVMPKGQFRSNIQKDNTSVDYDYSVNSPKYGPKY